VTRQPLLLLNAVTAKERLTNNSVKTISRIFVFDPGDLHAISLEDFLPPSTIQNFVNQDTKKTLYFAICANVTSLTEN
jgi:hypothetical protein